MRTQTMRVGSSPSRLNSPPPLASPLASPLQDGTASGRSGSERPISQLDEPRPVASKEVRVMGESTAPSSIGRLTERNASRMQPFVAESYVMRKFEETADFV